MSNPQIWKLWSKDGSTLLKVQYLYNSSLCNWSCTICCLLGINQVKYRNTIVSYIIVSGQGMFRYLPLDFVGLQAKGVQSWQHRRGLFFSTGVILSSGQCFTQSSKISSNLGLRPLEAKIGARSFVPNNVPALEKNVLGPAFHVLIIQLPERYRDLK